MSETNRMRALLQKSRRGPSDLVLVHDAVRPVPGPGELLVRVNAAGVNFADVMQTHGTYGGGLTPPYLAGFEAAGEVVAIGPDVPAPPAPGSHVVGTGAGAFAEYMAMPAASALPVPDGWTDAQALGMVLNWATALAALRLGEVRPGTVVLVHAAAGGVGQAAVQLARHHGARVLAAASPAKHGTLRALGVADADLLDGSRADLAAEIMRRTSGMGVGLVLESVGKATFSTSLAVTRPFTGRIVVFGAASGDARLDTHDLVFNHQVHLIGLHIGALATTAPALYRQLMTELAQLIAQGVYRPGAVTVHPLAYGPTLLREMEERRTTGKNALDPWAG
jgi:NADPH:quinone reductase-like Zn-dependent oxidoreductase